MYIKKRKKKEHTCGARDVSASRAPAPALISLIPTVTLVVVQLVAAVVVVVLVVQVVVPVVVCCLSR